MNIDQKDPFVNCVGHTIGYALVSQIKQDAGIPQQKCCVSCVGAMLNGTHVNAQSVGVACDQKDCMGPGKSYEPRETRRSRRLAEALLDVYNTFAHARS